MLNLEQNFRNLFGADALPFLDELFFDSIDTAEDPRSLLFHMESTSRELDQKQAMASLGVFSQVNEGEIAPKDNFNQTYSKNYSQIKYAKSIGISEEMIADDRWDLISKMTKSLGRSAQETQLLSAFNVFNNSFTTETSYDGVSVISASHPTLSGNQSNTLASPADLTYSSLSEAETLFRSFKDERGKRLMMRPKVLLVAEANRHNALEIVQSPYKAGTANNNINALGVDGGLKVVSSPFITDADAWWLLAGPEELAYGARIIDREKMSTKTHEDNLAGVLYYVCKYRQALGVDEWRGIVGTEGV